MRPSAPRAARTGPLFRFRFPEKAAHPDFKKSIKRPLRLFDPIVKFRWRPMAMDNERPSQSQLVTTAL
jgi:hypothetical protein